jgi:hypothetical protein
MVQGSAFRMQRLCSLQRDIHGQKAPVGRKHVAHSGECGLAPSPVIDKIWHLLGFLLDDWWESLPNLRGKNGDRT